MVLLARKLHSQHHHRPRFEVDTADSPKDDESDKESDTKLVEDEDIEDPEASYFGVNQFEPCKFGTVLHVYSIFMQMFDGFRATFQAWQISKHLCVKCQHLNMLTLNLPEIA